MGEDKVLLLVRPQIENRHSIEEIYTNLYQNYFSQHKNVILYKIDRELSFIQNIKRIIDYKANILHITGDVYYYSIFLFLWHKIILTIHDVGHFKNLKGTKKLIYKWIWLLIPIYLSRKIITISNYTKSDLINLLKISHQKIVVINNPLPYFDVKNQQKIDKDNFKILQVGTGHNKNLETVIKAISGLPISLDIVGKLSQTQLNLLNEYSINYKNYVDLEYKQVLSLYSETNLLAFVSLHEGFGMPVIEAQSIGVPVIASSIPAIKEIAGDSLFYVSDPKNVEELEMAIKLLMKDENIRKKYILGGYKNIEKYSAKKISKMYLDVYKSI